MEKYGATTGSLPVQGATSARGNSVRQQDVLTWVGTVNNDQFLPRFVINKIIISPK